MSEKRESAVPGSDPVTRFVGRSFPESATKRKRRLAAERQGDERHAVTLDSLFGGEYIGRRRIGPLAGRRIA
jgi:hypothetical protein